MSRITLSRLLSRMDQWTTVQTIDEVYKVRALDEAIRALRRETSPPWTIIRDTLRVFKNVLIYPTASNHDELAFLDNEERTFGSRARFRFTSLSQFLEDLDYRNDLAEIWDNGTKYLGVRYSDERNLTETRLNNAETAGDFTASGGASAIVADTVVFKEGNGSIRFTLTSGTAATVTNTFTSFSDSNFRRKYHFKWVYLDTLPTSIELRLRSSAGNYLGTSSITTQFSGQSFTADTWNLISQDLNTATETGTFSSAAISSEQIILTGAATGTFYIDTSYLRGWTLLDYWYYSRNSIALVGETTANQEYFLNSSDVYAVDSQLVSETEWTDVMTYDAILQLMIDKENDKTYAKILDRRKVAWDKLMEKYPNLVPVPLDLRYRFTTDFQSDYYARDN